MNKNEYFISGIDTDCGKTYITGLLAKQLENSGVQVITSKLVQTGCVGVSEDIIEHRRLMEMDLLPEDIDGTTCPFVFTFPASPHLATEIDKRSIDFEVIRTAQKELCANYELVLAEGAGGLMVPITENYLTIDYIKEYNLPLILVSSSKLGSINHTLLSIDLCLQRGVYLHTVIYNQMPGDDIIIARESFGYFKRYLDKYSPSTQLLHGDNLDAITLDF
ncbi:MAG: ATP-dependent dethiobiotin synthetase BioD [Flavobacteriaceae bacterium]|nr:ATP-dependent dethiobiotin synthetase BioD [Flavobacteriaceae bacterium]